MLRTVPSPLGVADCCDDARGHAEQAGLTEADEALVARVLASRDTAAFGELVARHQSTVRGVLRKLTGDHALADDLAQDTFIHAWRKLHTFAGRGRFRGWLLRVAHSRFLMHLRKRKSETALAGKLRTEMETTLGAAPDRYSGELPDLNRLLSVLSDEERSVLVLSYGYGLTHVEIGQVTGLPLGTVKSHIHRGKARIQSHFSLEKLAS